MVELPAAPAAAHGWSGGRDGSTLPMSDHCLACGAEWPSVEAVRAELNTPAEDEPPVEG